MSDNVNNDFVTFFGNLPTWNTTHQEEKLADIAQQFSTLNFREMLKARPLVIDHLDKNYNFYHQLAAIVNNQPVVPNPDVNSLMPDINYSISVTQSGFFAKQATSDKTQTADEPKHSPLLTTVHLKSRKYKL